MMTMLTSRCWIRPGQSFSLVVTPRLSVRRSASSTTTTNAGVLSAAAVTPPTTSNSTTTTRWKSATRKPTTQVNGFFSSLLSTTKNPIATGRATARSNSDQIRLFSSHHADRSTRNTATGTTQHDDDGRIVLDPLVVCGPSGVGKGTIIQRFMQEYNTDDHQNSSATTTTTSNKNTISFGFSVSHTTRAPRPGEVDGVHYHFVSHDEMQQLLSSKSTSTLNQEDTAEQKRGKRYDKDDTNDFFLEWAQVHGNYYGTSWQALAAVQQSGRKCLLDIDIQGVQRLKALEKLQQQSQSEQQSQSNHARRFPYYLAPKYIFIAPPSLAILEQRLRSRGTETEEQLQRRLHNAARELEYGQSQEPSSTSNNSSSSSTTTTTATATFDAIVINEDLDQAVQDFANIVYTKLYKQSNSDSSNNNNDP